MYYFGYQRIHHIHVGYFFTVPVLLVALHLLEGAGPSEPHGHAVLVLLVREVGGRARVAALRRGWLPDGRRWVARRLASRGCLFVGWRGVARRDCASVRGCQAKTAFLVAP